MKRITNSTVPLWRQQLRPFKNAKIWSFQGWGRTFKDVLLESLGGKLQLTELRS